MNKAVGIGESILDIIFRNGRRETEVAGGSVFNGMVSLARSGNTSLFISELSNDDIGRHILEFMKTNSMPTDFINIYESGCSPCSHAYLDENCEARYDFFRRPPEKRLPFHFPEIEEGDVVIMSSYFAVNPEMRSEICRLLDFAKQSKALIYYDINFRKAHSSERQKLLPAFLENFRSADIVRASRDDLNLLFQSENYANIYDNFLSGKLFIVTDGENDIFLKLNSIEKNYPVEKIKPVSTIGAGDNFNAGVVDYLITNKVKNPENFSETVCDRLIARGCKFAAAVCLSIDNYIA
jgi:fructokinase